MISRCCMQIFMVGVLMGFRIETKKEQEMTVIQVAGTLSDRATVELEQVCRKTIGPLSLDLTHLQSVEAEGLRFINELKTKGVPLTGASPYLQLLLK